MVTKKVWIGSTGPFLFDDSVLYIDEEEVIYPDNQQAIATNGQIVVQSAPSSPVHVVRKQDLDDALGDITAMEGRITTLESQMASAFGSIDYLSTHVATLEAKFTVGFFTMYVAGFPTEVTAGTYYAISDKFVAINIPNIGAAESTAPHIDFGNIPVEVQTVLSGAGIAAPLLVYDNVSGWDWAKTTFNVDAFWKIRVIPFVKSSAFPVGVGTLKGVSPQQLIFGRNQYAIYTN